MPEQVSQYYMLRNSFLHTDKHRENICIVLLKADKYVGELVSLLFLDICEKFRDVESRGYFQSENLL